MPTCFVIQPFDRGKFDKRYQDVFRPAIEKADLEPYRVDHDPAASIPIADIEEGIRGSTICFADITTDNPNVWFELGFAIAEKKPVVLVCAEERQTAFPFDVQHRSIIKYKTDSPQDFTHLSSQITARLEAALRKEAQLTLATQLSPVKPVEGLEQHEIVALVSIAENAEKPDAKIAHGSIRHDMERAGFTRLATTLALAALLRKSMVLQSEETGYNDSWTAYSLTQEGLDWLLSNKDRFKLAEGQPSAEAVEAQSPHLISDDDIPF